MMGKKVSETKATIQHQVLPHEANMLGDMHGGMILRHMDAAAAMCAFRYARSKVLTAAIEHMTFIAPVHIGEILMFHTSMNFVGNSSMEVGVRVETEDYLTGDIRHVCTGYITFVSLDANDKPKQLPPLIAETDEDKRRMNDAARRMALSRLEHRHTGGLNQYLVIRVLEGPFAFCRLDSSSPVPSLPVTSFLAMTRTAEEVSLLVPQVETGPLVAMGAIVEAGFACLKIENTPITDMVGVMATLSSVLAAAQVPIRCISTFSTDYILLRSQHLEKALRALDAAGHSVFP